MAGRAVEMVAENPKELLREVAALALEAEGQYKALSLRLEKAIAEVNRLRGALFGSGEVWFMHRELESPEDVYTAMDAHLNCPACGGSGHVEDAEGLVDRLARVAEAAAWYRETERQCYWMSRYHTRLCPVRIEPDAITEVRESKWRAGVDLAKALKAVGYGE